MAPKKSESFVLSEATLSDVLDISRLAIAAFASDALHKLMTQNVTEEDHIAFWEYVIAPRLTNPHRGEKSFKIVDTASGKMVAYTHLIWPCSPMTPADREAWQKELKERILPPTPGLDKRLADFCFYELAEYETECGFDDEEHFSRQGTFVHPDFQGRGLGSLLSRHCNKIADQVGAAMFVGARPASLRMFLALGFEVVGQLGCDLMEYGQGVDTTKVLRREPERLIFGKEEVEKLWARCVVLLYSGL